MAYSKLFLLLNLGFVGTGSLVADVIKVRQETVDGDQQTVIEDSKGAVVKIQQTIRDTSWSPYITYSPDSFYELLPQLYKDKISVREAKLGKLDFIFSIFVAELPRQWQPSSGAVTVWHLDLLDALTIAVQAANPAIAQAALAQIPYTKSVLASGKTTDFINLEPFNVDGKFKIDHYIDLLYDSMITKINKYRTIKGVSITYATSLQAPYLDKVARWLTLAPVTVMLGRLMDVSTEQLRTEWFGDTDERFANVASGFSVLSAILAHRLEHMYMNGYIKVLDLLVSSENVVFDRADACAKIAALRDKFTWFGKGNADAERLQEILNKIS